MVTKYYPYIITCDHDTVFMDATYSIHSNAGDAVYKPGFDSRAEAESALPRMCDELERLCGCGDEESAGFGVFSSDGGRQPVNFDEYTRIQHLERYFPYVEDAEGVKHFRSAYDQTGHTLATTYAEYHTTLDGAKRKLAHLHRTALDHKKAPVFTKTGVLRQQEPVYTLWSQQPVCTGNPGQFFAYAEGEQGRKYFFKAHGKTQTPTLDWRDAKTFTSLEAAKNCIPDLKQQSIVSDVSGSYGVVNGSGYKVFEEQADWYIPYVCAEYGADLFLCKDDQEGLTRDQNKAWGTSTVELALEKAKQIHRIAFDSGQALLGTSVGVNNRGELVDCDWSDLVASGEKSNLYFPYVLDTHDGRTYLLETSGTPHQWTQFLCDAQGYTNVEDAKNMIQRLVELVHEDCYFPEDLHVGVMNGYGNKFFEDAIVCPASVIDEPEVSDPVNNPEHYKTEGLEAIDVVEAFFADNYLRGNVFKYIARAGKKDPNKKVEDLQKAAWYLNREIEALKEQGA
uniref:Nucelotide kinase n=1 Tax=Siphoviridae sp. ctGkF2 TaxID=2827823 RepID=A0A8S5TMD9_9CAUD|nr:MAG TPA: nucelotide kinase [Siphoviridae sp. ctGkF2]